MALNPITINDSPGAGSEREKKRTKKEVERSENRGTMISRPAREYDSINRTDAVGYIPLLQEPLPDS